MNEKVSWKLVQRGRVTHTYEVQVKAPYIGKLTVQEVIDIIDPNNWGGNGYINPNNGSGVVTINID